MRSIQTIQQSANLSLVFLKKYTHTDTQKYMNKIILSILVQVWVCECTSIFAYVCVSVVCRHEYMHVCIHMLAHECMHVCVGFMLSYIYVTYIWHTHTHIHIWQHKASCKKFQCDREGFGSLPSCIFGICDKRKPNRWINITPHTILFLKNMGTTI